MNIKLTNAGKRYGPNWIFRNFSFLFSETQKYAILGLNGSGKSTLLKIISGSATLSQGTAEYSHKNKTISPENIFQYVSAAAPWLDMPEEYTLEELVVFHTQFRQFVNALSANDVLKIIGLENTRNKHYKNFSSGMQQRVKLGLAVLTDAPLLLLDEPATALDSKSIQWYKELINQYAAPKTILVFSNNREEEYTFCSEKVQLSLTNQ